MHVKTYMVERVWKFWHIVYDFFSKAANLRKTVVCLKSIWTSVLENIYKKVKF